ncbi:MAG TPA: nuclear transport factor 2 family protein [Aggregicoccus sp.]|nr:nuclear transport factor 2 family protein [Aggregicoccus sp.]
MLAPLLLLPLLAAAPAAAPRSNPTAAVGAVLEDWHAAAAAADEARYFAHFTRDAVFLGTDGTERWTRDQLRTWAKPFFARGKAWSFRALSRNVAFSKDGQVAWFDEALDTPNLGPARGSGVLVREGGRWRIAQYNLSVPIPNALMDDFKARIERARNEAHAKPR